MHFGLEPYVPLVMYYSGIVAILLSIFWRPVIGIYYLVPLIPLQTLRYGMMGMPLGHSVVPLVLIAVAVGLLLHGEPIFPKTPWTKLLVGYMAFTFVSLCLGSFYLGRSLPLSLSDPRMASWKDYMCMPFLLLLTASAVRSTREIRIVAILLCLSIFALDRSSWGAVAGRDFSHYSDDLRDEGSMGYAGVNGLAAFEAQAAVFLLGLSIEKKKLLQLAYLALAGVTALCLMYSLSRGGYVAFLLGWLFVGVVRKRKLLALLIVFGIVWASLVPRAVSSRVQMTYDASDGELDHSSETRVTLWEDAMQVFDSNPLIGAGFNTYAYMGRVGAYRDTHNYFVKVLVETGVFGLLLFLWLLWRTFSVGYRLSRRAKDPFLAALGLGLAGWVVTCMAANMFGDRWTFLQVNGYMWVIAGLVARGWAIEEGAQVAPAAEAETGDSLALSEDAESVVTGAA